MNLIDAFYVSSNRTFGCHARFHVEYEIHRSVQTHRCICGAWRRCSLNSLTHFPEASCIVYSQTRVAHTSSTRLTRSNEVIVEANRIGECFVCLSITFCSWCGGNIAEYRQDVWSSCHRDTSQAHHSTEPRTRNNLCFLICVTAMSPGRLVKHLCDERIERKQYTIKTIEEQSKTSDVDASLHGLLGGWEMVGMLRRLGRRSAGSALGDGGVWVTNIFVRKKCSSMLLVCVRVSACVSS